jgi:hypothetical protein
MGASCAYVFDFTLLAPWPTKYIYGLRLTRTHQAISQLSWVVQAFLGFIPYHKAGLSPPITKSPAQVKAFIGRLEPT